MVYGHIQLACSNDKTRPRQGRLTDIDYLVGLDRVERQI